MADASSAILFIIGLRGAGIKNESNMPFCACVSRYGYVHFSPAKNVCACSTKNDTWSISGNVIGSEAKMPVEMKKIMAVFLTVIALWFSCHSKRSKNILVKVLSGMFSLENVAPWKRRTNPVVVICRRYWLCNRRHGCERHAKKVGNFDFLCLLLVSCTSVQQEIVKKWKKNYWALLCI